MLYGWVGRRKVNVDHAQGETVKCPACGWQNRPGAKFCAKCRAPLAVETAQHGFLEDMTSAISGILHQVQSTIAGKPDEEAVAQAGQQPAPHPPPAPAVEPAYSAPTRRLVGP
ncbi:MAG TPA: zinc ribbon domain-containing protein, partial [Anaerolineaceae bacterium]